MNNFKIFSKCHQTGETCSESLKKSVIIAHLYYEDKFNNSFEYLNRIDEQINIVIVTANDKLEKLADSKIKKLNKNNIKIIKKKNRGRDFAALFITCKDIIKKYEYICFVHDKRSHKGDSLNFGDDWGKCLLENTIGSNEFVLNIINYFEKNKDIGILSAPMPPEEYLLGLRGATWTCNEENATNLLMKLSIPTKIDVSKDPYTIGSCFWFRKTALDRMINYDFKYEDFSEEPMPLDGSLAHAIERCLCYVSSYETYHNYYILNAEYAQYYITMLNEQLTKAITILRDEDTLCYSDNKTDLEKTLDFVNDKRTYTKLIKYCLHSRRVFVIEDGFDISKKCLSELKENNIQIENIYSISNIDYKKISVIPYRIIICVKDINCLNINKFSDYFGVKPFIYE